MVHPDLDGTPSANQPFVSFYSADTELLAALNSDARAATIYSPNSMVIPPICDWHKTLSLWHWLESYQVTRLWCLFSEHFHCSPAKSIPRFTRVHLAISWQPRLAHKCPAKDPSKLFQLNRSAFRLCVLIFSPESFDELGDADSNSNKKNGNDRITMKICGNFAHFLRSQEWERSEGQQTTKEWAHESSTQQIEF